jgi:hypothetical protein
MTNVAQHHNAPDTGLATQVPVIVHALAARRHEAQVG